MNHCPTCTCDGGPSLHSLCPPEPPVGTWVRDRFGGTTMRQPGGAWAPPGFMPLGNWQAMWDARGPLVECGPYGAEVSVGEPQ